MQWLHKYRRRLNKEDRDALDAEAARMIGKMVKVMDPEDGVDVSSNLLPFPQLLPPLLLISLPQMITYLGEVVTTDYIATSLSRQSFSRKHGWPLGCPPIRRAKCAQSLMNTLSSTKYSV